MGVNLSGSNVFMTQHFLHITQSCTVKKQVSGEAVSQTMRTNFNW
jgi:hypothetical protein